MTDLRRAARSGIARAMSAGQARIVLFVTFLAALLAAAGLLHTASRVAVVGAGYRLSRVEVRYRELLRERERLLVERATLRAAPRLEAVAREKLNMARPTAAQLVALADKRGPLPGKAVALYATPGRKPLPRP
jgi:cell division protein FtsL